MVVPKGILIISPMLLGMIYKFIVPIMAAYLTFKIPSGKLIAVFQKSSMPQSILLILVVIIRFIPTISGEIKTIKEAMKVRGFMGSKINVVLHPLRTMEYIVVPLIFRSVKVGDELAAAAIVRGIENPGKKQGYYETKLSKTDYVILAISLILLIICII
ncbi:cobalt transport family protein [Clostridioides difficile DA00065]|nr:cobalt transport family protein [Clostridioides difficile DA00065]